MNIDDIMYENKILREENTTLKLELEKYRNKNNSSNITKSNIQTDSNFFVRLFVFLCTEPTWQ
jgi:regulator of replication initiation timing